MATTQPAPQPHAHERHYAVILIRLLGSLAGTNDGLRIPLATAHQRAFPSARFAGKRHCIAPHEQSRARLLPRPRSRRHDQPGNNGNGVLVTGTASETLIAAVKWRIVA